ncbi:MAG TPA: hypothetical protein VEF04_10935 [Blastocatellia bacterium]|nr:hypothetical protein [Blastocatellia bacterium]
MADVLPNLVLARILRHVQPVEWYYLATVNHHWSEVVRGEWRQWRPTKDDYISLHVRIDPPFDKYLCQRVNDVRHILQCVWFGPSHVLERCWQRLLYQSTVVEALCLACDLKHVPVPGYWQQWLDIRSTLDYPPYVLSDDKPVKRSYLRILNDGPLAFQPYRQDMFDARTWNHQLLRLCIKRHTPVPALVDLLVNRLMPVKKTTKQSLNQLLLYAIVAKHWSLIEELTHYYGTKPIYREAMINSLIHTFTHRCLAKDFAGDEEPFARLFMPYRSYMPKTIYLYSTWFINELLLDQWFGFTIDVVESPTGIIREAIRLAIESATRHVTQRTFDLFNVSDWSTTYFASRWQYLTEYLRDWHQQDKNGIMLANFKAMLASFMTTIYRSQLIDRLVLEVKASSVKFTNNQEGYVWLQALFGELFDDDTMEKWHQLYPYVWPENREAPSFVQMRPQAIAFVKLSLPL